MAKHYYGNGKPVNVFRNQVKLVGYHTETKSGDSVSFDDTYNDIAEVELTGNTVQASDYYAKDGLSSQAGTPSPDAPIPISSNLPAGTYKYTSTDGIYEFILTEDLRGINTVIDKIVHDRKSHRGILERRIYKSSFTGLEAWSTSGVLKYLNLSNYPLSAVTPFCSHFVYGEYSTLNLPVGKFSFGGPIGQKNGNFYANKNGIWTDWEAWLVQQNTSGNPVTVVYQLATPTRTPLTFTKVASSSATEVPMTFLTSTPSLDYPADVIDANGNLLSNGEIISALPTLRKVGTVADSFVPRTGKKIKRISDWVNITGVNGSLLNRYSNFKRFNIWPLLPYIYGRDKPILIYKYDSKLLNISSLTNSTGDAGGGADTDIGLRISIFDANTGFGDMIIPTSDEIKSYFYGWKMCNADGTAPYYKSEVPYTPATWVEWGNSVGITKDSTGIEISALNGSAPNFRITTTVKPSTKYGVLYNVVSKNINSAFYFCAGASVYVSFPTIDLASNGMIVGNNKLITTSKSLIQGNNVEFATGVLNTTGTKIKLKNIRIFELPTGSQIEADFNNLTADQLAAKYTFNGLCPKNWKHIVGNQADINASKTAVLPTATYTGYTPYKMLYQLATPVEESYTPAPVPTHLGQTIIETDSMIKPTINAVVKVPD